MNQQKSNGDTKHVLNKSSTRYNLIKKVDQLEKTTLCNPIIQNDNGLKKKKIEGKKESKNSDAKLEVS